MNSGEYKKFEELGLDQWLLKLCWKIDYKEPRPIQVLSIPPLLQGKNVLISSQTGTGKTAAFSFPILQTLSQDPYGIFAIILTASRELAVQIAEQIQIFGASVNLRLALLIGGLSSSKQVKQLGQIPHIIIGTPGRCSELLSIDVNFQKYIKNVKYFILDEVDRLLEPQIWDDIKKVYQQCESPQIALVSATLNNVTNQLKDEFEGINFVECINNPEQKVSETIKHKFVLMPDLVKDYYFIHLMKKLEGASTIVFAPTCRKCHELNELLNHFEIKSTCLHSMLPQHERISNLRAYRSQKTQVLVATDVASRGLDIPNVKFVINWNVPKVESDYVHRVGRTGRAGKRGTAITMMTQFDVERVLAIENLINLKMEEIKFNEEKVLANMTDVTKAIKTIKIKMQQDGTTEKFLDFQKKKVKSKQKRKESQEEEQQ
ncbi:unnamed protein product [Paramecium pentaurelia]|uniref:RNA helicase n=1 Tax=Paramecium pentaurelia TaxID=43138 RepID=A0A8S1UVC1_9CILI|nr:unnamed protein product [Paramecium pentaurelia]